LGCRWVGENQSANSGSELVPETSSKGYTWLDSNCIKLSAGFSDVVPGVLSLSIEKRSTNCTTRVSGSHAPYDLQSKLFLIGLVKVNPDNVTAAEVLIKFKADNKYELISFALSALDSPPLICDSLTEADFNAISTTMKPEEINKQLGCQWHQKISSNSAGAVVLYEWSDHECNGISVVSTSQSKTKTFNHHRSSGCGTFTTH
ncbi:MAG: hypothetical protein KAJ63_10695, partial [Methyloprofundus sp.]|nr:hypothetical protein [Methyloprofundus sp.]